MLSTGSNYGGKRAGSGRYMHSPGTYAKRQAERGLYLKKWQANHKRISIAKTVCKTWEDLKSLCKYSSDTAFAKHLLSLEMRRREK